MTLEEEELYVLCLLPNFVVLSKHAEEEFVHETEISMTTATGEKKKRLKEKLDEPAKVSDEEQEIIEEGGNSLVILFRWNYNFTCFSVNK